MKFKKEGVWLLNVAAAVNWNDLIRNSELERRARSVICCCSDQSC
jgi:hypothetical protein